MTDATTSSERTGTATRSRLGRGSPAEGEIGAGSAPTSVAGAGDTLRSIVAPPWPRRRATALALGAVLAIQATALFAVTRSSFFAADDFLHFWLAQVRSLPHYLVTPILGVYPAPGHRLATYLLHTLSPLNYTLARLLLLLMLALATIALSRVVRTLAMSDEPWTVALLAPFALSLTLVPSVWWWSTGPHVMGLALFTAFALSAWLRSYADPRPRLWLLVTMSALLAAGAFHSKFLLVPVYLVLLRLLILPRLLGLSSGLGALWAERMRWVAVFLPAIAYVVVLVLFDLVGGVSQPGDQPYAQYLTAAWFHVAIPVVFANVHLAGWDGAAGSWAVVVLSQALFAGVVIATWKRTALAPRAWAFFVAVFMLNALMLGVFRLPTFGIDIAYLLRYYPEVAYILPVVLAVCFRQGEQRHPGVAWEHNQTGRRAIVAYVCLLVVGFAAGAPRVVEGSGGALASPWVTNLLHDLRQAEKTTGAVHLLDADTPEPVMPGWMFPQNRIATVVSLTDIEVEFNELSERTLMVREDGHLARPEFETIAVLVSDDELGDGVRAAPPATAGETCLQAGTALELPSPAEVDGARLALRIDYAGASREPAVLEVESGHLDHALHAFDLWPLDRDVELIDLRTSRVQSIRIEPAEDAVLCFRRVEVGVIRPAGRAVSHGAHNLRAGQSSERTGAGGER